MKNLLVLAAGAISCVVGSTTWIGGMLELGTHNGAHVPSLVVMGIGTLIFVVGVLLFSNSDSIVREWQHRKDHG